ncbi:hypothetical protein [Gordonia liuliyuniae]|uniref:Antitoxin VbhA domain-containing protein n=1 Tax=Gordonia liuliyuniae TaxID=2911517 RepID=A0ABS9IU48_9ACTN|nr:hypothetical protein [Gordonia liuliyuniae]MCF8589093.1 hypothetical protein [Gordonia liuliyuniae]
MSTTFEEKYADLLDRLNPVERRAVVRSVTNAIQEGWDPTRSQIELQVRRASGEITGEQARAQIIAAARGTTAAHSSAS